jgi:cell division protein FtsL
MRNKELKEQKRQIKRTRLSKKGIYLLTLITLFLISFSLTSFIIINANRLIFSDGETNSIKNEIASLKEQIIEKDKTIEELTLQLSAKKSSSFSPPPTETQKPKASSSPKPSSSPSASPSPTVTPKPSSTPKPTASPKPTVSPTPKEQ